MLSFIVACLFIACILFALSAANRPSPRVNLLSLGLFFFTLFFLLQNLPLDRVIK